MFFLSAGLNFIRKFNLLEMAFSVEFTHTLLLSDRLKFIRKLNFLQMIFSVQFTHYLISVSWFEINTCNSFSSADRNNVFANSVDPDEIAYNEPFYQDLRCLLFCFEF